MHLLTLAANLAVADTLIDADTEHGGYGGPSATFTTLDGAPALMVGGRGAWIVDHRFSLGGAMNGLIPSDDLHLGYGGLWLEYTIAPDRAVHGGIGTVGGFAWIDRAGELAFVPAVEPMLLAEANVTTFLRIAVAASWRQLGGAQRVDLSATELSGPGGTLHFRFGRF